jgi:1-acyl-sn-glycerol-3-phosphate acyltransferase
MVKGAGGREKPGAPTQRPAKRAARAALGNDPFERGAAPVQLAMATPAKPAAAHAGAMTGEPSRRRKVATPAAAAAPRQEVTVHAPAVAPVPPEAPVGEAHEIAGPPADDVHETAEAAAPPASDLRAFVHRLWPALRGRLDAILGLPRLLGRPSPGFPQAVDTELVARALPLLDFLLDAWWRVEVRDLDRMPAGPALVVANHGGLFHWDALVLAHVLRRAGRELRPLLDEHALSIPIAGRAALRLGAVPATPENALELLREGVLTGVFPEGSRNGEREWAERYRIRRFGRGGFATIALRAGVPVVPCAIVGGEETAAPFARPGWLAEALGLPLLNAAPALPLRPLALLPLPSRWSVRFGEPILPHGSPDDARAVNLLAEETRGRLQRMLDEDVASRRSVYF